MKNPIESFENRGTVYTRNGAIIVWTDWRREGYSYQATLTYRNLCGFDGEIKMRYGFFTYHLIRWIHGEQVMREMIFDRIDKLQTELTVRKVRGE